MQQHNMYHVKQNQDQHLIKLTPVKPPTVNKNKNPSANNIGVLNWIDEPHNVAIQLKTLIPVGTAIIIVAAVK